ncbi:unnamed protein product, partial [Adineta ricciae]
HRFRLIGKGIKRLHSPGTGDHYVHIKIKVPSRLTAEQKALVLSYAELDKDTDGTINGLTQTKSGNRVINEDDFPLLKSVRQALSNLPLGSKKVADTIDERETDTKRNATAKKQ